MENKELIKTTIVYLTFLLAFALLRLAILLTLELLRFNQVVLLLEDTQSPVELSFNLICNPRKP